MKIAILGNDHTNTLGLVQAVGIEGHEPYAFMWGLNTGIVKSSKYIKTTFSSHDADGCVQLISQVFQEDDGPIIILCSCYCSRKI